MLQTMLANWGYDVIVASDASEVCAVLQGQDPPNVAILDSMLPGMDGLEVCRRLHVLPGMLTSYIIMLVRRRRMEDVFAASLDAGADDYISQPFDPEELRARLAVSARVMRLRERLADRERELQEANSHIRQLESEQLVHAPQNSSRLES